MEPFAPFIDKRKMITYILSNVLTLPADQLMMAEGKEEETDEEDDGFTEGGYSPDRELSRPSPRPSPSPSGEPEGTPVPLEPEGTDSEDRELASYAQEYKARLVEGWVEVDFEEEKTNEEA